MKNFILLFILFISVVSAQQKPNIVLLFVDDYGWSDVGYRNDKYTTPNIDQLKKDGVEFTRAYVSTPTCSPSRASILTGKESVRMEMVRHIPGGNKFNFINGRAQEKYHTWPKDPVQMKSINWLPLKEVTYAERLKQFGYYNMFVGKWHLGSEKYHPIEQGFDAQYGTANAGHPDSYYAPFFKYDNPLSDIKKEEYLTNVLTDKSVDFIKSYNKKEPFMLSMWYYNVHSPFIGRKDFIKESLVGKTKEEKKFIQYKAMVTAMDESVGRIRKSIVEKGIADNTVIIFSSDQGGYFPNTPLSGGKLGGNTLGEGGARVPFIVYYPGMSKSNSEIETPIQTVDVYPTLVEIASGKKCRDKWVNGKSILPLIKQEKSKSRDLFFFRSYEDQYAAIINDDWKLVKYHSGKYQLFNVANDISEQNDLIGTNLSVELKLKKRLASWEADVVKKK